MAARVLTLPRRDAPAAAPPRYRRRLTEPVAVFLVAAVGYLGWRC